MTPIEKILVGILIVAVVLWVLNLIFRKSRGGSSPSFDSSSSSLDSCWVSDIGDSIGDSCNGDDGGCGGDD